jgi:hypothetical protein
MFRSSLTLARRPLAAAACAAIVCVGAVGCGGSVGDKQIRIEAGSVASTATESALLAGQRSRAEVPLTFTRIQAQTLAKQFDKSLQSVASKPAQPATRKLADRLSLLALYGQQQALLLASEAKNRDQVLAVRRSFYDLAGKANVLASEAQSREARQ